MKIYIIRHGETEGNQKQQLNGWSDIPLTSMGIDLAMQTGKALRGETFDIAYSSPLIRAEQTAILLLKESGNEKTPLIFDNRIKEIFAGDWEGISVNDSKNPERNREIRNYLEHPKSDWGFPSGETIQQVKQRTQEFLMEVAKGPQQNILVSTHGCALRCMLNFLYGDTADLWQGHIPYNCAVSIVSIENGCMKLIESDRIYYDPALCVDRYSINEET